MFILMPLYIAPAAKCHRVGGNGEFWFSSFKFLLFSHFAQVEMIVEKLKNMNPVEKNGNLILGTIFKLVLI